MQDSGLCYCLPLASFQFQPSICCKLPITLSSYHRSWQSFPACLDFWETLPCLSCWQQACESAVTMLIATPDAVLLKSQYSASRHSLHESGNCVLNSGAVQHLCHPVRRSYFRWTLLADLIGTSGNLQGAASVCKLSVCCKCLFLSLQPTKASNISYSWFSLGDHLGWDQHVV